MFEEIKEELTTLFKLPIKEITYEEINYKLRSYEGIKYCDDYGNLLHAVVSNKYDEEKTFKFIEELLSHGYFFSHTEKFFEFYREKMLCLDAKPNKAHLKLAELEKAGKLRGVITQNIDGLHQKAGSKNVMELHGSVLRNYCERCLQFVSAEDILHSEGVPKCPKCGGRVKPDVVLYEEGLNQKTLEDAIDYISHAEVLIIGGTSLAVYPAAGLIDYYNGDKLVLINKSATPMDKRADLLIQQGLGTVFEQIQI